MKIKEHATIRCPDWKHKMKCSEKDGAEVVNESFSQNTQKADLQYV